MQEPSSGSSHDARLPTVPDLPPHLLRQCQDDPPPTYNYQPEMMLTAEHSPQPSRIDILRSSVGLPERLDLCVGSGSRWLEHAQLPPVATVRSLLDAAPSPLHISRVGYRAPSDGPLREDQGDENHDLIEGGISLGEPC
jgi:hypothetical protein